MDCLKNDPLLTFNEDTIQSIRKEYDLDKPGRMDQAIDILVEWLKKQDHFLIKEFRQNDHEMNLSHYIIIDNIAVNFLARDYLERRIIFSKGLLERVKRQLDRSCVFKTLLPTFFENIDFKSKYKESDILIDAMLPKLTEDHYRIYYLKNVGQKFENGFINYYRFTFSMVAYILAHDYCKGLVIIFDLTEANLFEIIKNLDISHLRQAFNLLLEAYGMRVKGIHVVYPSKTVETLTVLLKQVVSAKIAGRIHVHNNVESLHKFVTKPLLPNEAGGTVGSIKELHEKWINAISSKEFQEVYNKMKEAKTNEEYRQLDKFKNEYLGMPGTFRSLNVD